MSYNNWIGLPPHPTDDYVHWSDKNAQETMLKLREAWNKLEEAGLLPEVKLLIKEATQTASLEEAYNQQDFS